MKKVKLDDIYKKYPFIYEIDGDYYYIGWGICKKCVSDIAISYYSNFLRFVEQIGVESLEERYYSNIDEEQLDALLYFFRKVKAYSDLATDEEDMPTFRSQIGEFVENLAQENQASLQHQLEVFVMYLIFITRGVIYDVS